MTLLLCLQIRARQETERNNVSSEQSKIEAKKEELAVAKTQLAGAHKLLTQMNEQKSKFAKAIDKKSLDEVKSILSRGVSPAFATGQRVLEFLFKFLTGDTQANYDRDGAALMISPEAFQAAVRSADPARHEKAWIRDIAQKVNMTPDQRKGEILAAVTDELIS